MVEDKDNRKKIFFFLEIQRSSWRAAVAQWLALITVILKARAQIRPTF